jgi:S1-C subfamily serine protease
MFDITGQLTAINLGGRQGLPMAALGDKFDDLLAGKDLIPTPIGIRYTAVPDTSNYRLSTSTVAAPLGTQPAAQVTSVIAGSLAEKAGFQQKDFLVSINGKPLSPQFFSNPSADLEGRTGSVKFIVIRDKNWDKKKPDWPSVTPVWTEVELKLDLEQR